MKHLRIVVGMDGSPQAQAALRWASRLAASLGAEIVVVHALGLLEKLHGEVVVAHSRRAEIEDVVEREWCSAVPRDRLPVQVVVEEGHPVDVLLDVAARQDAHVLVMGSRGVGSTPALALGSTSLHVLQLSSVPTLIVPDPESSSRHIGLRRTLVAVDGSPTSLAAVEVACRLAVAFGSRISVVEAVDDAPLAPSGYPLGIGRRAEVASPTRVRAPNLRRLRQRMRAYGIPVDVHVHRGTPDAIVPRVAASTDADLVVMGCHRGGADADLLSGSVSRRLVGSLHRPALVVPQGLSELAAELVLPESNPQHARSRPG